MQDDSHLLHTNIIPERVRSPELGEAHGSVLLSSSLRAARKRLSMRFEYRTTQAQVVDDFRLLDSAADEIDRLRAALQKIEKMPWPDSEAPYALIAREALGRDGPNTGAD